jgi:DNA (cytosine-5)-methyltransferase 1
MGYTPAAGLFSAAEVGAPHQRLRIFILAHTSGPELERQQQSQRCAGRWQVPDGSPALPSRAGLHPPGPDDHAAWAAILAARPDLAPALCFNDCLAWARRLAADSDGPETAAAQPALRRMADGLAHRARALRLLGNGVHPLAEQHMRGALSRLPMASGPWIWRSVEGTERPAQMNLFEGLQP